MPELPRKGPLPQPQNLEEARATLRDERIEVACDNVHFEVKEFTSLCPRTGQPDFMTIDISYTPDRYGLESKALKFYLWAWRQEGAFAETLAEQIAQDIYNAINPSLVNVAVHQNVRGGIALTARSSRAGWTDEDENLED